MVPLLFQRFAAAEFCIALCILPPRVRHFESLEVLAQQSVAAIVPSCVSPSVVGLGVAKPPACVGRGSVNIHANTSLGFSGSVVQNPMLCRVASPKAACLPYLPLLDSKSRWRFQACVLCHSIGVPAPFSLLGVEKRVRMIFGRSCFNEHHSPVENNSSDPFSFSHHHGLRPCGAAVF